MPTVTSKDGTKIAFDKVGSGPAVILVNGAIAYRAFDDGTMAQLAKLLGEHFTVYNYDRRGRGESGNTLPFTKQREIEDLQALVEDAGEAMVLGFSSGSAVTLDTTAVTPGITKVAVYEAPFIVDDSRQPVPTDYAEQLMKFSIEGKHEEAVEYFARYALGIPDEYIGGMKQDQATWSGMTGVGHTIAYDAAFVGSVMQGKPLPTNRWSNVTVPVLVLDGGASDAFMGNAANALAKVLPNARRQTLEGQTHSVDPKVLAPVIIEFFKK